LTPAAREAFQNDDAILDLLSLIAKCQGRPAETEQKGMLSPSS
jgi:hypothetical protein